MSSRREPLIQAVIRETGVIRHTDVILLVLFLIKELSADQSGWTAFVFGVWRRYVARTRYIAITPDSGGGVNGVRVSSRPRNLVYY